MGKAHLSLWGGRKVKNRGRGRKKTGERNTDVGSISRKQRGEQGGKKGDTPNKRDGQSCHKKRRGVRKRETARLAG